MPKISALPGAGPIVGTELLVCVQGGITCQTTVSAVVAGGGGGGPTWTTPPAGNLTWQNVATTASMSFSDFGSWNCSVPVINFGVGAGGVFTFHLQTAGVTTTFKAENGGQIQITATALGGIVTVDDATNAFTIATFTTLTYQYIVGGAGNWNVSPVELQNAVDRLAAAVAGLLGGPIP